jgi:membrane-associated phospholipid phosphatase
MARNRHLTLAIAALALFSSAANAKTLEDYATDAKDYALSPLHWDANDWRWAGGALVSVAAAYSLDHQVRDQFVTAGAPTASNSHPVRDAAPLALMLVGTFAAGALDGHKEWMHTSYDMGEAVVLGTVSATVLKALAGRERPNKSTSHSSWGHSGDSFPSGHTTAAFAAAQVFSDRLERDQWGLRVLAYGLATATAYARLNSNVHWFSDTVAGAALGMATGRFMSGRGYDEKSRVTFWVAPMDHGALVSFAVNTN